MNVAEPQRGGWGWNVQLLMDMNDIEDAAGLARSINAAELEVDGQRVRVTPNQMARLIEAPPDSIDRAVFVSLCTVLHCSPGDLVWVPRPRPR
ncbi:helix-turn-helix domain-containing protein [Microbacterium foliorum]|uniref:helix-turn-helix domain-containing protein n=1 Tax=Microbacterium foliorum TaxID=104336 RepID=UPI0015E38AD0|nr:helix-turn-helix transcriptional regulator [Microbacterium foliorum]